MAVDELRRYRNGTIQDGGLLSNAMLFCIFGLLYSFFFPFLTTRYGIPSTPVYGIVVIGAIFMILNVVPTRKLPGYATMLIFVMMAYLLMISAQSIFFGDPSGTVEKRYVWAITTAGSIICLCNADARSFKFLVRAVVVLSVLIIHADFLSEFSLPIRMTEVIGRSAGLYMNPNTAALFLAAAIPIVTVKLPAIKRLLWYVLIASAVFVTFSRGGVLLCAAMIAATEFYRAGRYKRVRASGSTLGILITVAVLALCYVVYDNSQQLFGLVLDDNAESRLRFGTNDSSEARLYVIQMALTAVQESMLFGRGIGYAYIWDVPLSVHNMFVLVLLEQGIVGLVWLGVFLLSLYSVPKPFGLWAVLVFAIGGMFNHNLFDSPVYGLLIAMYVALPAILEDSSTPQHAPLKAPARGGRLL